MRIRLRPERDMQVRKVRAGRVPLLVCGPPKARQDAPGVLWIHGGGYLFGMKEMVYMSRAMDLLREHGAILVSPGYRLAWQKPWPAALEDCYAALEYMHGHARDLGFSPDKIIVGGESAGGGLCAAVCMMARDKGRVGVRLQLPLYPMLSCLDTPSSRDNHGRIWNTRRNHLGWRWYLRGQQGTERISPYASPALQEDHAGLPPCYTFVGDGEPFFSETLDYVKKLQEAGVWARADVHHTDIHAFDMLYPNEETSRRAILAYREAVSDAMGLFLP